MRRRTWLIALSVLALIAAGVGVANWLFRKGRVGPGGQPSAAAGPAQHRVERWKPGEELLALAGQKAVVLSYSGGDVDFWIEVESRGKRWKSGEGVARQQRTEKPAGPGQTVEGYFVLARSEAGPRGKEVWRLGCQRDLVAADSSEVRIGVPRAEAILSRSDERKDGSRMLWTDRVTLWENPEGQAANRASFRRSADDQSSRRHRELHPQPASDRPRRVCRGDQGSEKDGQRID